MSEEAMMSDANLAEIARLRVALKAAEADNAVMRRALDFLTRVGDAKSAQALATGILARLNPADVEHSLLAVAGETIVALILGLNEHRLTDLERSSSPETIRTVLAELAQARAALKLAAPTVCSMLCPSVWKTSEGRRPHSETCQTITKLIDKE